MQTYFSKNSNNQECILVGCVPSAAVAMSIPACIGHCVSQHALGRGMYPSMHWRGGCFPRGSVCPGGVCPGWCVPQHPLRQTPPLRTEWLTDRYKNITFPQLRLRTVKMNVVVLEWITHQFRTTGSATLQQIKGCRTTIWMNLELLAIETFCYIGLRLQRVQLQRAPSCKKHISLHQNYYIFKKLKSSVYNGHTHTSDFLNHFTHLKGDPV